MLSCLIESAMNKEHTIRKLTELKTEDKGIIAKIKLPEPQAMRLVEVVFHFLRHGAQHPDQIKGTSSRQVSFAKGLIMTALDRRESTNDGAVHIKDLTEATGLSKSTVSETVDQLCNLGMLLKSTSTSDRRSVEISLTDLGRNSIAQTQKRYNLIWLESLTQIHLEDLHVFRRVLAALHCSLSAQKA